MNPYKTIFLAISTLALSGCAATMLVGGLMENEIEVTLDNDVIPVGARNAILKAKVLGVIASDRSSIKAADIFETQGGWLVKIDRQTAKVGEMTGSERRDAMTNLCKAQRVDAVMLARVVATETGSVVAAAFTGRVKLNQKWVMDVHTCGTGASDSFGGALNMNVGMYNAKAPAELEEKIGAAIANRILAGLGKAGVGQSGQTAQPAATRADMSAAAAAAPGAPGAQTTQPASPSSASVATATLAAAPGQPMQRPADARPVKVLSTLDVQQRLAALGYDVGKPDGVPGKRTAEAIRKFQRDNRIPSTGSIDEATAQRLTLGGN